jgi:TPR repeat protein
MFGALLTNSSKTEDHDRARDLLRRACLFGDVSAMGFFGLMFEKSDPVRWKWLGKAAKKGERSTFLRDFVNLVQELLKSDAVSECFFFW